MNIHIEAIKNHQIHSMLRQAEIHLVTIKEMDDIPIADFEIIQRIEFIFNNFKESISCSDKQLISIAWLDEVAGTLNTINSYLANYYSSRNATYITTHMVAPIDIVLNNTVKINTIRSKNNLQGMMSSIEKYQNTVSRYLESIEKRNKRLEDKSESISNKITSLDTDLQKKATNFENAINQEKTRIDAIITTHQSQIADNNKEFQNQQKEFLDKFSSKQNELKEAFENQHEDFNSQIEKIIENHKLEIQQFKNDSEAVITSSKEVFDKYQEDVKNIVGIVNTNMFSHKYKEVADDAHKRAKFWHGCAIVLMILLAIFSFYSFVITLNQDTSWVKLVAKIFAATTVATGAAYAARQASKQEKVERYARKIEMEMVAIDPFLESLTEEQRQEVKREIARTIFGKTDSMEITNKDEAHTALDKFSNAEDALSAIIKLIGKIK